MFCPITKLAQQLIKQPSLSPNDAGCQELISTRLKKLGFIIEHMPFGNTKNLWAWHGYGRTLVFAGHTDVVSVGDIHNWYYPPFEPTIYQGMLYGRGAADMKGSLASIIIAVERFIFQHAHHPGRLAFLITSDEEADAKNGTNKVIDMLIARQERLDYCLIGEPSSKYQVGDTIKNGRRGSLNASLIIYGTQGHVAYPHLADNPIHRAMAALKELIEIKWDTGNIFFPPTTMQIVNIQSGVNCNNNVIPSNLIVKFNFRFSNELTETKIRQQVEFLLKRYKLRYHIDWSLAGQPFLTSRGELIDVAIQAVEHYQKIIPRLETTGGTSDGRFIARLGAQVVELGLLNDTIHKVNECTKIADLQTLSKIYQYIIEKLLIL